MNKNILKTKTDLDPLEYKKLFGNPFWNEQGHILMVLVMLKTLMLY